jgi:two-component system nitrate/nitrite response regulator NarL
MTGGSPVRVFVADDHPLYRSSVVHAIRADARLTLAGEAEDGRIALDAIRELQPDVAVVDLRMPGLDGTQIADAVRRAKLACRVILLSGHVQADTAFEALQRGASGVLSKLADADALTDAIVAVARGQTMIAPEIQTAVVAAIQAGRDGGQAALSSREREVLALVAEGATVPAIAQSLNLSASTIKTHLEHIYRKLGVSERAAAVAEAMRRGILH